MGATAGEEDEHLGREGGREGGIQVGYGVQRRDKRGGEGKKNGGKERVGGREGERQGGTVIVGRSEGGKEGDREGGTCSTLQHVQRT